MANEIQFDRESMRNRMMSILEALESHPTDSPQWQARLRQLYLLSMGVFKCVDDEPEAPAEKPVPQAAAADISEKSADKTTKEQQKASTSEEQKIAEESSKKQEEGEGTNNDDSVEKINTSIEEEKKAEETENKKPEPPREMTEEERKVKSK